MRTPWRFVADLVSRKPKADAQEAHSAVAPELLALEYQPATEKARSEIEVKPAEQSVETAGRKQGDADHPRPDASRVPVQISEDGSIPAVDKGSAISADAKDSAVINAPTKITENVAPAGETPLVAALAKPVAIADIKRRKMNEPVIKRMAPLSQTEDDGSVALKSLIDEMADLDAEVDALRRQLAKKLSQQNAQLRKMLARFDAR
jgi:hypothetical protein